MVSEVVGVGILLTPATMLRMLGGVWRPIAMWAVMGLLSAAGALCYAELSTRFPRAGGAYVFLREGFGKRCAFVYGWMAILVMDPGITAALGIGLAQYLLATFGVSQSHQRLAALACIAALGLLTLRGLAASALMLRWAATFKLVVVAVLVLAGLAAMASADSMAASPSAAGGGASAIAGAIVAAFFAFGGWWDLGRMSEEVESPKKGMPAALIAGVLLVTAIYMLVTAAFVLAAPAAVASEETFVAEVGNALFGAAAGRLLAAIVVVTVAGSLAAVLLGAPRTYLAMARDGLLPSGRVWFDAERGRSLIGTLVQCTLASALVMLGSFDQILGYFIPCAVFFLGLAATVLLRLDRTASLHVFLVPFYPVPLILFLALVATMLLLFVAGQPVQTMLGAAVVLAGLVASRFAIPTTTRRVTQPTA